MDRLELSVSLFKALDESIDYTHWKSNEHLEAAVRGRTDLDLLVRPEHRPAFASILDKLGFVLMVPDEARRIPGVESYLGFDSGTGSLLHLDVNYRLVVGERLLKNHHLPLENWILSDGGELEGVRIPSPARELTLLYMRAMLKTTSRQLLRAVVKGGSPIPERIQKEARWLSERVEDLDLIAAVPGTGLDIDPEEVIEFRRRVDAGKLDRNYVADRTRSLRRRLRGHERLPSYRAAPKRLLLRFRSSSIAEKVGAGIPPRHLEGVAPFVAAVGADGSGKSRLSKDLEYWLGSKLAVRHVYFGQPKSGFWWKLLNKPGSVARGRGKSGGWMSALAKRTDSMKWVWLARHRRRLATQAHRDAEEGMVVIAERFPLPEFQVMAEPMDGPRLQGSGAPGAQKELVAYRAIDPPDLTIVLHTDIDTLRARKIDLGMEEHQAKVKAVSALEQGPGRVVLDAGPPYERVLLEAKTAIWDEIRATR